MVRRGAFLSFILLVGACQKGGNAPSSRALAKEGSSPAASERALSTSPSRAASSAEGPPSRAPSLEAVREYIAASVRIGYEEPARIVDSAVELHEEELTGIDLRAAARRLLEEELAAQRRREAEWTTLTDCDRLDRAFVEIEQSGVIARQNFSDCGTCGASEIMDEIEGARAAGEKVRGYVFFHMQDSERALDGMLYLSYGAVEPSEDAQLAIAREVVAVLQRFGLNASWNGRYDTRVGVSPIDWRKRRFTKAPPP